MRLAENMVMCGRYTMVQSVDELVQRFQVDAVFDPAAGISGELPDIRPRYNLAPRSPVPVVIEQSAGSQRQRVLEPMQWWLVPNWSKDSTSNKAAMFNARDDRIREAILGGGRSAFAAPFRRRRCLIPADGFYEWIGMTDAATGKPVKQPIYFQLADKVPYAFAGLWDEWTSPDGSPLRSCVVITTSANALVEQVHDRMPVILRPEDEAQWVSSASTDSADAIDPADLLSLLRPYPAEWMTATPVSTRVNSVRADDSGLIEPVVNSQ